MEQVSLQQEQDLEAVLRQYSDMVYRVAYTQTKCVSDAEDVYQEVFLQYVKKNPVFASEEHRKAWLLKVTINYCKKLWRSAWRRKTTLCETVPEPVNLAAEHKFLLEALRQLPLQDRTVLHLFYYEDLPVREISRLLEKKESTVRTQLTRARDKLKEILKEDWIE